MAQVRIVDGKLVVNEESLFVTQPTAKYDSMDVVNESGNYITSASFMKKTARDKWDTTETDLFYKALSYCGTDFSLLNRVFPHKTRDQVKNKYKKEEKQSPEKIEHYLKDKKPLNVKFFESAKEILAKRKPKKSEKGKHVKQEPSDAVKPETASEETPSTSDSKRTKRKTGKDSIDRK